MKNISPYKLYWVEFTPESGVITMHDQAVLGIIRPMRGSRQQLITFGSKEHALRFITTFSKRLDKHYICRLFTDAQFGRATVQGGIIHIPFTKKQLEETYTL